MNTLFFIWALLLVVSGLFHKRVRLVPFAVLCAVAFVSAVEMRGSAHFIQQLSGGFFILSAMLFSRAPKPQKEFIWTDIFLNSFTFLAYLASFSIYPHIARITTPAITTLTALILIGVTLQHKKLWSDWKAGRPKRRPQRWNAKEATHGR